MGNRNYGTTTAAVGQQQPVQPSPDDFLRQGREIGVLVPMLQNLMGGLAVMLLIATGAAFGIAPRAFRPEPHYPAITVIEPGH